MQQNLGSGLSEQSTIQSQIAVQGLHHYRSYLKNSHVSQQNKGQSSSLVTREGPRSAMSLSNDLQTKIHWGYHT